MPHYDDAVIGSGIVGLAHAYHLARAGRRVVVFDRQRTPQGASIRSFGMVWPIGQRPGAARSLALRSQAIWLEVIREAGLWHDAAGSLHLAYREDEEAVLREFVAESRAELGCQIIDAAAVQARAPHVRVDALRGALFSDTEICVDPREVVAQLPGWLARRFGVEIVTGTLVTACAPPVLVAGGREWRAARAWVCSGDDLQTLFPEVLGSLGLRRCKLQMMRSKPLPQRIGSMLAAALTLRQSQGFACCPSLPALSARLARDYPDHVRAGIHVLVAQHAEGAVTIGASHEYDDEITPFDSGTIDARVLRYLRSFFRMRGVVIDSHWHATYVQHPDAPYCVVEPAPGVTAVTGLGGAGMTLAFGLAERVCRV
jgi:FAD dependent oxidoreductase TIGR03364